MVNSRKTVASKERSRSRGRAASDPPSTRRITASLNSSADSTTTGTGTRRRNTTMALRRSTRQRAPPNSRVGARINGGASDDDSGAEVTYDNNGNGEIQATVSTNASSNPNQMSWYERLMPEFLLSLTSPITGYESRLDSDVEDEIEDERDYEILETQRLRRNRGIRRRLAGFLLIAAAASAFMYTRGRLSRRMGVHAAVSSVAGKIESGINRIQDRLNG